MAPFMSCFYNYIKMASRYSGQKQSNSWILNNSFHGLAELLPSKYCSVTIALQLYGLSKLFIPHTAPPHCLLQNLWIIKLLQSICWFISLPTACIHGFYKKLLHSYSVMITTAIPCVLYTFTSIYCSVTFSIKILALYTITFYLLLYHDAHCNSVRFLHYYIPFTALSHSPIAIP